MKHNKSLTELSTHYSQVKQVALCLTHFLCLCQRRLKCQLCDSWQLTNIFHYISSTPFVSSGEGIMAAPRWKLILTAVLLHVRPQVPLLCTVCKGAVPNVLALLASGDMHADLSITFLKKNINLKRWTYNLFQTRSVNKFYTCVVCHEKEKEKIKLKVSESSTYG